MGILVGLNVIDCNLCFKEEDLDSQQGVIDFSLYLRTSSRASPDDENVQVVAIEGPAGNMTAVLDQKNYIEELNRHLKYVYSIKPNSTELIFIFYVSTFVFLVQQLEIYNQKLKVSPQQMH